jgi:PAS domain S-box-containing protein
MMHWQYTPYVLPLVIAAGLSAALALFVWRHRSAPGAKVLVLLMLAAAEWSLGYGLELVSADLPTKLFWGKVAYLGIAIVPTAWLAFALQYTGREKWLTRRNLVLLVIEPSVTLLLAWTNDLHGLIYSDIRLDTSGPFSMLDLTFGVGSWVDVVYAYLLLALGALLLIQAIIRSPRLYRRQVGILLIGASAPLVAEILSISGLIPSPHLDLTPFAFTLSGLAAAWSFFHYRLLDIVPVAHDAVVKGMSDSVILLDAQNRIVDLNPAAQQIIGCPASEAIGQPAAQVLSDRPDLVERYRDVTEAQAEIVLGEGEAQRTYDLRISPLHDRRNHLTGRLVVLRDITERKQAEESLRQRTAHLEALRQVGLEITAKLDLDTLLHSIVSRAIELLGGTEGGLYLYRPDRDVLEWAVTIGPNMAPIGTVLHRGEGLSGRVWETGEPLIVDDYQHWEGHAAVYEGHPWAAVVGVPVHWGKEFLGVLDVLADSPRTFSPADAELLSLFATQAAIAIVNARLYKQAQQDAETKAMLLREVNHRVKNNLAAIIGLLYAERRYAGAEEQSAYQSILEEMTSRVQGLARVHSLLSSSGWSPLLLSDLITQVIRSSLQTLPRDKRVSVDVTPSPVRVTPDQAHNLALVINELATNTIKYALQERNAAHIAVRIAPDADIVRLEYRDDGPGYPEAVLRLERHNVGFDLIQTMVCESLRGELSLHNDHGAVAVIRFKAEV